MPTRDTPPAVLHVVDTLDVGGLERVVTDLVIAQQAAGQSVAVFAINECGGFRGELEAAGVPVVVGAKRGTLDRRVLRLLRATVRERRVAVVHTHNFVPNYYAALATLALRDAPALVNTVHNMGTRLAHRRLRWLYLASLRRTRRVAMVGRQVHERFVGLGLVDEARAVTVMNAVPAERFGVDAARRVEARARLGIVADAPLLGCVGRLVELKNHRLLIERMPELLRAQPQLRLVVLGDGPLRGELQALVDALGLADRVTLAGARGDVHALLPGFDVFVLPSRTEGLSIALLEACASGLAVVASAVGGNPEIVRDGETGLLFASDDGAGLGVAVRRLITDPVERQRLGTAARDWVLRNASTAALRDAYAGVYRAALDAHR